MSINTAPTTKPTVPTTKGVTARAIFPSLRYDDAPRAVEFLCHAFGFRKYAVLAGSGGAKSQLKLGSNYIMVGSTSTDSGPITTAQALAGALGGVLVISERDADVDAHYARARAAGATIVDEPVSAVNGGRSYTASDSEGHVWSFSSGPWS